MDKLRSINWRSALLAGLVATAVMTVFMTIVGSGGMPKMMGALLLGSSSSVAAQWIVGLSLHGVIGLTYGLIFAELVAFLPLQKMKLWAIGECMGRS